MTIDSGATGTEELLGNIKRLARIILDRLEEGSKDRSLDQGQTRLYSSILIRSLCLWLEALNPTPRRRVGREVRDKIDQIIREMMREKEDRLEPGR